ncbi:MAG: translesion error-prone DNA polymerase V autoproteolytic subunit [Chlamydiia bacterium]|nr:translesion error-prone DNA polymerase V autoproteolytic subunit [Chlamydiia bacterium]
MNKEQIPHPLQVKEIGALGALTPCSLPIVSSDVQAGFPSPADDYIENHLDLNELMIKRPAATFFVRVEGDSMTGAGIDSGDTLVVDRSLEAADGRIIIAVINGEFTVKRFLKRGPKLAAENPRYPDILISENLDFQVWGVVTYVIKSVCTSR